jgi:hypothetical protein
VFVPQRAGSWECCSASVTHPHRRAMRVVMMVKMAVAQHDEEIGYGNCRSSVNQSFISPACDAG